VGILGAVVLPARHFTVVASTEFFQGGTVRAKPVGHDYLGAAMPFH